VGLLCLPCVRGVCQDPGAQTVTHRPGYRPLLNGIPVEADRAQPTTPLPPRIVEPIQKTEPEYTAEARLAELEGVVMLRGEIDEEGFARNLTVAQPIGLGLDQNAMDAVKQWHFEPVLTPPQEARPIVRIAVDFRLTAHQSRWHLIQVQFDTAIEAERPVFLNAEYPIGAGLGPEAREEGLLVVAMGRLATAKIAFDIDEHGVPVHLHALNTSHPVWGSEATAVVGQWRFTPGTRNGISVLVPCTVELAWGEKELTADLERQLHDMLAAR
jgi:TonB family protein